VHEQVVTPWDVQGSVSTDGSQQAIDYDKLIDQFGTRRIDDNVLERFEKLIGCKPHIFLRRGLFFSHRLAFCYLIEMDFDRYCCQRIQQDP
jgi:tryptophanyl-tRNA synthetase